jgi:hypothetical protein
MEERMKVMEVSVARAVVFKLGCTLKLPDELVHCLEPYSEQLWIFGKTTV